MKELHLRLHIGKPVFLLSFISEAEGEQGIILSDMTTGGEICSVGFDNYRGSLLKSLLDLGSKMGGNLYRHGNPVAGYEFARIDGKTVFALDINKTKIVYPIEGAHLDALYRIFGCDK